MEKITVIQLIYGLKYGGAEKLLIPLVRSVDPGRYRMVVTALTCGGPMEDELRRIGADVRVLRRDGKFNIFDLIRLIKLIKAEKAKIVHSHLLNADIWGGVSARILGLRHVSTIHGTYFGNSRSELIKQSLRMRLPDKIIAVSRATKDICVRQFRVKEEKIKVINSGVDFGRFQIETDRERTKGLLGIKNNSVVVGTFGRLEEEKGCQYLIESIPIIRKKHRETFFIIIGEGSLRESLMKKAVELKVGEAVRFLGGRGDMPELLKAMDVVVFPSIHEGFSIAALEAMAATRPVVATRVGGMEELITDGKDGLLVESGNSASLARSVMRLIEDKPFALRMAHHAAQKVSERFTEDRMRKEIMKVYEESLSLENG
ncbi:glycosyltransferase [Candidatus Omnitrophota bacterium]